MKIAVNTRLLLPGKLDGIGWFTYETLSRITRDHPDVTFLFLFDRPWDRSFLFSGNVRPLRIPPPARHPFLWYVWLQQGVRKVLEKEKPDVFFSPDGFLPLPCPVPSVPVIHDLNFFPYPKDLPLLTGAYYRRFFPRFAREASRILTVSRFSAHDIATRFSIPEEKITVAYNGISEVFSPLNDPEKRQARERFSGGHPYFVHVGSLLPRKNLPRLLQAYDLFRSRTDEEIHLVLAGREFFGNRRLRRIYQQMHHAEGVHFADHLDRQDTRLLIGGAEALLMVSYFEGFGIPVVEAMACHTPVIAARATALPEVAGGAALLVDPFSVESIAGGMIRLHRNPGLQKDLIRKGAARASFFSWDHTAGVVWNTLLKAAEDGR